MKHRESAIGRAGDCGPSGRRAGVAPTPGQAMVEFALVSTVALLVLLVAIQFALVGEVALAVNQAAYQAARFAAVNINSDQAAVSDYVKGVASPSITNGGGTFLTINLSPETVPRTFSESVTVTVAYDLNGGGKLFLPTTFLGVPLPTSLSGTATAFSE